VETKSHVDKMEVPPIGSLQELIDHLKVVFASDTVDVDYVKAVLASYKSNPQDWKKYAMFDKYR
jgi:cysteine dioxygenase